MILYVPLIPTCEPLLNFSGCAPVQPLIIDASSRENPSEYPHKSYTARN